MMFVIYCEDKPGHEQVRADARPEHVDYLKQHGDQIFAAGPTLSDDGQRMTGSVLLVDFPDRAGAEAFSRNDPYTKAGLFARVEIKPWKKTIP